MDNAVGKIIEYINQVDSFGYLLIGANILLLIFAKVILKAVYHQPEKINNFSRKVMIFRALNLLIIIAYGYFRFFQDKQNKTQ